MILYQGLPTASDMQLSCLGPGNYDEKSQELNNVATKEESSVANIVRYPFQYQEIHKDENVLKCPEPRCNSYPLTIQRGKLTICGSWGAQKTKMLSYNYPEIM